MYPFLMTNDVYRTEKMLLKNNGGEGWYLLNLCRVKESPGFFVGAFIEITDKKAIESEVEEVRLRLEMALYGANLGLWDIDITTSVAVYDQRWCEMLGYAPEEIEPCRDAWKTLVHPDDLPRVEQQVAAHLAGETEIYRVEQRLRHKQGHWVWVLSIGKVVARDASGNPLRATGVHMDITHQQRLQDQGVDLLRQIEALIQRAGHPVNTNPEPVVPLLTERQRQILELVAAGLTSEEIGKQLNISTATAVTHRRNIMQAVGARSSAELIKRAAKYGWI